MMFPGQGFPSAATATATAMYFVHAETRRYACRESWASYWMLDYVISYCTVFILWLISECELVIAAAAERLNGARRMFRFGGTLHTVELLVPSLRKYSVLRHMYVWLHFVRDSSALVLYK